MPRVLVVSNRLPLTATVNGNGVRLEPSAGGLATGLRAFHGDADTLWIGWPGLPDSETLDQSTLTRDLAAIRCLPVWLTPEEVQQFYEGIANGVLWPLFHYLLDQVPLHVRGWDAYERVNARFADAVAAAHRPGDLVWVHDYQLMLVPRLLRERLPDARIGFFLHIPFPGSEVFRTLPFAVPVLRGLLGADLVGFHTAPYLSHFASSLLRLLGITTNVDRVEVGDRSVRLGVFPMGIDAAAFAALGADAGVLADARTLRGDDSMTLLVGIDRLDYTKGIPRRLLAFETMLQRYPELLERVRLVQVAVPSRTGVEAYQDFRHHVEGHVGRINGAFGTPRWAPVHYISRNLDEREVVALYRAADVMLVTPVRDGMNLVAKEFVAARVDGDGVLVLSEFAGAAAELAEAVQVNPYDVDRAAEMLYHVALTLPEAERRFRMRALRKRVFAWDVGHWTRAFLDRLVRTSDERTSAVQAVSSPAELAQAVERMRTAEHLLLLLDYDGTLVPFTGLPELAVPDQELLALLRTLATRPRTAVHVVSGRTRDTLERWLGALPIGLHAEHGFWSRPPGSSEWTARATPALEWRPQALAILEQVAARTPGSLVEEKTVALAWHYRMADPLFGAQQANELAVHLTEILSNAPVEILTGNKVIENRPHGIHKGALVATLLGEAPPGTLVGAFGDDRTDEDMFAALPADAVAIHVGPTPSRAPLRVPTIAAARRLLEALVPEPPKA